MTTAQAIVFALGFAGGGLGHAVVGLIFGSRR